MRGFNPIILLVAGAIAADADQKRGDSANAPYLWEVIDAGLPVEHMAAKTPQLHLRSAARSTLRSKDNCVFPLDVVILQDATDSFSDNIQTMAQNQLDLIFKGITSKHPDSKFGVISFKDKPITPLGNRDDYCSRLDAPLSGDFNKLKAAYTSIVSYGGADAPENQFGTLYNALGNAAVGWSSEALATKLVVVSTDAGPHFAGDDKTGLLPAFNPANSQDELNDVCLAQYYPSPEQIKAKISASNAYVASLVYDGDWANGWPSKSWIHFNRYIGQTEAFVAPQAPDSSDFWSRLASIIDVIEDIECAEVTTTSTSTTRSETTTASATTAAPATIATTASVTTAGSPMTSTQPTTPLMTQTKPAPEAPCECPCDHCTCCPEVIIKLQSKPKELHLDVKN